MSRWILGSMLEAKWWGCRWCTVNVYDSRRVFLHILKWPRSVDMETTVNAKKSPEPLPFQEHSNSFCGFVPSSDWLGMHRLKWHEECRTLRVFVIQGMSLKSFQIPKIALMIWINRQYPWTVAIFLLKKLLVHMTPQGIGHTGYECNPRNPGFQAVCLKDFLLIVPMLRPGSVLREFSWLNATFDIFMEQKHHVVVCFFS